MFALPAAILIVLACYTRFHELVPALQTQPVMSLLYAAGVLGVIFDLRLRLGTWRPTALVGVVVIVYFWIVLTVALNAPSELVPYLTGFVFQFLLVFILSYGAQSFRGLEALLGTIAAITVFLTLLGFDQGTSRLECMSIEANVRTDAAGQPDGRTCATAEDCYRGGDPASDYQCEKVGWFDTTSIGGGRVRYRGFLQDPNELSMAIACGLPLVLTFLGRRKSWWRRFLMVLMVALALVVTVFTGSRMGQIVVIVALMAMYGTGLGWKGLVAGALAGLPLLLLGGRGGDEASESTVERLEAWAAGFDMFRSSPIWGVGVDQFTKNHYLTAHNSLILVMAELGLPGMVLWLALPYTCCKIVFSAYRRFRTDPETDLAFQWARGLAASWAVLLVSFQFLSLSYHPVVWIYFGVTGAYYLAIRRHVPEFRIRVGAKDMLALGVFCSLYAGTTFAYLRMHGY